MTKKTISLLKISLIAISMTGYAAENTLAVSATNNAKAESQKILQLQIIQDQEFLNSADIANISITEEYGDRALEIKLTANGTEKLQQFSAQHIKQILQISWNGTILSQATLQGALPGSFILNGVSQEKMQAIVNNFHQLSKGSTIIPTKSK